jgi:glycosyltransferase involved in cell wall biosynthesis
VGDTQVSHSKSGGARMSLISVIIPVYNGRSYLAQAIDSALAQTYHRTEVIVIDDGSTDGSGELAKGYGSSINYLYQENRGISAARNCGVAVAQGEFFAFLDADDVWLADKLQVQAGAFGADAALDIAFGHVKQGYASDLVAAPDQIDRSAQQVLPGYLPSAMMVKRQSFFRVGPFDSRWRVGEFADWYLRARDLQLREAMLPQVVAWRRIHQTNNWMRQREARADYVRVLKTSLDRRRAAALLPTESDASFSHEMGTHKD